MVGKRGKISMFDGLFVVFDYEPVAREGQQRPDYVGNDALEKVVCAYFEKNTLDLFL